MVADLLFVPFSVPSLFHLGTQNGLLLSVIPKNNRLHPMKDFWHALASPFLPQGLADVDQGLHPQQNTKKGATMLY